MRATHKLTATAVAKASTPGYLSDGGNLFLQVSMGGTKSWLFRYGRDGKKREMGLGPYPLISLSVAREKAMQARVMLVEGDDPIEKRRETVESARRARSKAISFEECAAAMIKSREAEWRSAKHAAQWHSTLATYAYPHIGAAMVGTIGTEDVLKCLRPIWTAKTETATRVRQRIEAVLDWATTHHHREGDNPARWRGHLEHSLPKPSKVAKVEHHAAVNVDAVAGFASALRLKGGMGARALEFVLLTAARSGEVRGMTWGEVNVRAAVWTVPAGRMKAGKEHRVPLSVQALALLESLPEGKAEDLVFPAPRGGQLSDMTLSKCMKDMRLQAVPHGLRSTFRDWAGDRTHYPRDMIEFALAHTLRDETEAAYRRSDALEKRREMMQAWADFCG